MAAPDGGALVTAETGILGEVRVYWRPGCPFCAMLRLGLRSARIRADWVNIWEDRAAAARLRAITGGDETVPTLVVGARAMGTPPARRVTAAVRGGAPGVAPAARARPSAWLTGAAPRLTRRRAGNNTDGPPGGHATMKGQAPLRSMARLA